MDLKEAKSKLRKEVLDSSNLNEIAKALVDSDLEDAEDMIFILNNGKIENLPYYSSKYLKENIEYARIAKSNAKYKVPDKEIYRWWILPSQGCEQELPRLWRPEIYKVTSGIVNNSYTTKDAIDNISKWFKANMKFDTPRVRMVQPLDIMEEKVGRCGEWAHLCCSMLRSIYIASREAFNLGEDHVWVEVYLPEENRWVHFDPSVPSPNDIDSPSFYENDWKKDISYVYTYRFDGTKIDITSTYSDIGELEIVGSAGTTIKLFSKNMSAEYWGKVRPDLKANLPSNQAFYANQFSIDSSGKLSLKLGGGLYLLSCKLGKYEWVLDDVSVKENDKSSISL